MAEARQKEMKVNITVVATMKSNTLNEVRRGGDGDFHILLLPDRGGAALLAG